MKKQEQDKNTIISEDEFLKALDEMEAAELEELEKIVAEAEKSPHTFSKEYEDWKVQMIEKLEAEEKAEENREENDAAEKEQTEKEPFIYRFINTPLKKVAIVAVIAGAVLLGTGGQSEAGKFPVVKFFQKLYGDHVEIEPHEDMWSNEEKPQSIETVYELGWLPEGYEKAEEKGSEYVIRREYYNKQSNEKIRLEQYCVGMYLSIDEKDGYNEIKYEERKFYYLERKDTNIVVWYRDGYQFILKGKDKLDILLEIADGLEEIK